PAGALGINAEQRKPVEALPTTKAEGCPLRRRRARGRKRKEPIVAQLAIVRIPVLSDNHVWRAHDPQSLETVVVDPAVAEPVLAEADARAWTITAIWNTHWHPDHTGGNASIKAKTGCEIIAPAAERERIPTADRLV